MTLREEIAIALFDAIDDLHISQGRIVADAILPIVERAVREVLNDAITAAIFDGLGSVDADAIVRRVMGDE